MSPPVIRVSAALITDSAGRVLFVRKRGTTVFMQPGGKPEPGEGAAEALVRELEEELGLVVPVGELRLLGTFEADAANEPGHRVVADSFALVAEAGRVSARAEIEEVRWITQAEASSFPLAPLSVDILLPLAWPGLRPVP
ncbi:NUDIX hydrolase [Microbacterium rhizomatis]|uniref:NUDIX domain-containing protein n=1 Tax=Microbacterium rhizomatis TaxID=1631477 RepID=A0A5J5J592_9MICO|nr:NUDIX domain-containing protein [Microbacterium rhizomatis]KAA9111327.1 NUDIX domain-containing protein [Microbacterium rhizomatis]